MAEAPFEPNSYEMWSIVVDDLVSNILQLAPGFDPDDIKDDNDLKCRLLSNLVVVLALRFRANELEGWVREASGVSGEDIDQFLADIEQEGQRAFAEWQLEQREQDESAE